MARQVVDLEKLAEAKEAADAAQEAATLAAEKVANLETPAKAQKVDGMAVGYRVIRNGPEDFPAEGFFRHHDGSQRFRSAIGFPSEVTARQWVYDQQAEHR